MTFAANASGDDSDWAYRRTLKACKLCRKKKVRCDGVQPTCAQCRTHRSKCIYLPRASRTRPRAQQQHGPSDAGETIRVSPRMASQPPTGNAANDMRSPQGPGPSRSPRSSSERASDGIQKNPRSCPTTSDAQLGADMLQLLNYQRLEFPASPLGGEQHLANDHNEQDFASHCAFMEDISQSFGDVAGRLTPQILPTDQLPSPLPETQSIFIAPEHWSPNFDDGGFSAIRVDSGHELDCDSGVPEDGDPTLLDEDAGHSLQITSCGHMKYMGPSMSFLPATKIGLEWISHVTGSSYFSDQLQDFLNKFTPNDLDNFAPDGRYDPSHLPTHENAISYAHAYFRAVQSALPILDQPSFMHDLDSTYESLSVAKDPTWCAMVNVVLAIGCRAMPNSSEELVCNLFGNALRLFTQVALGLSNLRKVQTLTLMYIFSGHTTSPHWGYTMLSMAVREAQAIGLHLQPFKSWRLSKIELRQRMLLFWTLFCLDINLCFRLARPPMLKKSEISLSPSAIPYRRSVGDCQSSVPLYGEETFGPQQLQLFKKNIESSFLLHEVYEVISGKPDIASLEQRVPKLEQELLQFTNSLSPSWVFSANTVMQQAMNLEREILLPVAMLNCMVFIAQWILRLRLLTLKTAQKFRAGYNGSLTEWTTSLDHDIARTSAAAGSMIQMAQALPGDQPNMHWYFAPFCVFAFYALFLAILHDPLGSQSGEYMELMSVVIEGTVQGASKEHPLIADQHLTHFLAFFARTARMAITQAKTHRGIR